VIAFRRECKNYGIEHFFFNVGMLLQNSEDSARQKIAIVSACGLKSFIEALYLLMISVQQRQSIMPSL